MPPTPTIVTFAVLTLAPLSPPSRPQTFSTSSTTSKPHSNTFSNSDIFLSIAFASKNFWMPTIKLQHHFPQSMVKFLPQSHNLFWFMLLIYLFMCVLNLVYSRMWDYSVRQCVCVCVCVFLSTRKRVIEHQIFKEKSSHLKKNFFCRIWKLYVSISMLVIGGNAQCSDREEMDEGATHRENVGLKL